PLMARNCLFLRSIGMYRTGPESARIQLLSLCQTSGLSVGRRISTTSWPSSKATVVERLTSFYKHREPTSSCFQVRKLSTSAPSREAGYRLCEKLLDRRAWSLE